MNDSLLNALRGQLEGAPLDAMAAQLGASREAVNGAVSSALPLLLGALGRNASDPEGAEALMEALQEDHSGANAVDMESLLNAGQATGANPLGELLGQVLGAGRVSSPQMDASGILGHMLGGHRQQAEMALSQRSGLDGGQTGKLLMMLAPVVMGLLAKQARANQMSAGGLGSLLSQTLRNLQGPGGSAGADLIGAVLGGTRGAPGAGAPAGGLGDLLGKVAGNLLSGGRR